VIRLIGVLTGSALAIALLLLVLGVPRLGEPETVEQAAEHMTVVPVAATETVPPLVTPEPMPPENDVEPVHQSETEPVAKLKPEPVADPEPVPVTPEPGGTDPEPINVDTIMESEPAAQNWYAFWSPFRSRIAADGFVSELSRTTGLDYRVVKLKPGVFEVAVAYSDDADIQDKLLRISAATGLDMTGG